jgi:hypothetical protein
MFDTWTCHVCGKERPDALISVLSTTRYIGTIPMQQNVRYCNDNPSCIEGARDVDFMGNAEPAYDVIETNERVPKSAVELRTRFQWRANRRCRKLNEQKTVNWYRFEVHKVDGKWEVWAMQNQARPAT